MKYKIGDIVYVGPNRVKGSVFDIGPEEHYIQFKSEKKTSYGWYGESNLYGSPMRENNINIETLSNRVQSMYCYVKLNKALIYLSAICQWGDMKHGKGPIKTDVDYPAKIQAHLSRYLSGEMCDKESGVDHRIAVAFNCLASFQIEQKNVDLDKLLMHNIDYFTKQYVKENK